MSGHNRLKIAVSMNNEFRVSGILILITNNAVLLFLIKGK